MDRSPNRTEDIISFHFFREDLPNSMRSNLMCKQPILDISHISNILFWGQDLRADLLVLNACWLLTMSYVDLDLHISSVLDWYVSYFPPNYLNFCIKNIVGATNYTLYLLFICEYYLTPRMDNNGLFTSNTISIQY